MLRAHARLASGQGGAGHRHPRGLGAGVRARAVERLEGAAIREAEGVTADAVSEPATPGPLARPAKGRRCSRMGALDGRKALITKTSSGIGERATAAAMAAEGAAVALAARRKDRLDALVERIDDAGGRAVAVEADVADEAQARSWSPTRATRSAASTTWSTTPA